MRDLIIIGSGPAGLSAAIYAKRAMMDVVVMEKAAFSGGQIVNTEKVDNYLGMPGISGFDMAMKFREHADLFEIEFDDREVMSLEDHGDHKTISLEDGTDLDTRAVLVTTGARHRNLGVPGGRIRRSRSFILCYMRWCLFQEQGGCCGRWGKHSS